MALNGDDYDVSWSDFKHVAARPHGVNEDAEIHIQFPYKYKSARDKRAVSVDSVDINISTTANCWAVNGQMTSDLLKHEQGHYDITVIGVKEFYNTLTGLSAKSEHELEKEINKEYREIQKKIDDANIRYDTQTNHGQNTSAQQTWNKSIAVEKQKSGGSIDNLPQ